MHGGAHVVIPGRKAVVGDCLRLFLYIAVSTDFFHFFIFFLFTLFTLFVTTVVVVVVVVVVVLLVLVLVLFLSLHSRHGPPLNLRQIKPHPSLPSNPPPPPLLLPLLLLHKGLSSIELPRQGVELLVRQTPPCIL